LLLEEATIEDAVPPVDHVFPSEAEDVSVTLCPAHNVVGPFAKITGVAGTGFTVTCICELAELHPVEVLYTV
jgi:hypothetical protein